MVFRYRVEPKYHSDVKQAWHVVKVYHSGTVTYLSYPNFIELFYSNKVLLFSSKNMPFISLPPPRCFILTVVIVWVLKTDRTNKRNKERGVKTIELLHIAVQWKYKLLRGSTLLFHLPEIYSSIPSRIKWGTKIKLYLFVNVFFFFNKSFRRAVQKFTCKVSHICRCSRIWLWRENLNCCLLQTLTNCFVINEPTSFTFHPAFHCNSLIILYQKTAITSKFHDIIALRKLRQCELL